MAEQYRRIHQKVVPEAGKGIHPPRYERQQAVAFVDADNGQRTTVMLEEISTAECIRKGLVIPAEKEYPGQTGKVLQCMLNVFSGDDISIEGLDVMNSIFSDGVENFLAQEKNNG
jgi:hypothetical protein